MGSRSSSSNETKNITETNNVSASDQAITVVDAEGVTIEQTDHGAIEAAGIFAGEVIEFAGEANTRAADTVDNAIDAVAENSQSTVTALSSANQNTIESVERVAMAAASGSQSIVADSLVSVFKPLVIGIVVIGGAVFLFKGKKG